MSDDEYTVKDIRKAKEVIKEQKHKNDISKTAIGGAVTAGAIGGAAVAATSTATVTTGAALGSLTIGGSIGSWLVAHGVLAAATVSTTVVSAPIFFGIALPAIGLYVSFNVIKNHQANKLLKDFVTTANIDALGEKIAESIFLPVIYFLRTMNVDPSSIKDFLSKEMIKDYGFSEEFTKKFIESHTQESIDEIKNRIKTQEVSILLSSQDGETKKSKELKLTFLHDKAIKLCKECLNKAAFCFDETGRERGKGTIKYMKKVLFNKKKN